MARKRPCPISSRKMTCIHSSSNINVDNSISDIAKKIVGDMGPIPYGDILYGHII